MVRYDIEKKPLWEITKAQWYGIFVEEDKTDTEIIRALCAKKFPGLQVFLAERLLRGTLGETVTMPMVTESGVIYCVAAGLGARVHGLYPVENYRRALGSMVRAMMAAKDNMLAISLPEASWFDVSDEYLASQTVLVADMAYYHFDEFIHDPKRKYPDDALLTIALDTQDNAAVECGASYGAICARGVAQTRHWVDLPPDHMTPIDLAKKASEIASNHNFKITIFNEAQVNQMGMGGLAAVARGSERDCQLVILEYTSENPHAKTLGFVGKGITFDSGGLSIKPADYMETMKDDMAGAAAVLGAMDVIGSLKPAVNIVAVIPLAENLPSGKAIKPGDIVTFYNGVTGEILNTDAEGRLILADALAYITKHYTLDALVDLATLTGACCVALGHFYGGLLSEHDDLVARVEAAAKLSGEHVWRLPMSNDYKRAIRSEHADIKNTGGKQYGAGTITAACFLQHFVGTTPWAHIDIAGTAFGVPDISYYRAGATGFGVRLLTELAMHWR